MDALSIGSEITEVETLEPAGALGLPIRVESAAWAAQVRDDLFVLINRPGMSETGLVRVRQHAGRIPVYEVEHLPSLPLVSAGTSECHEQLLVTGADATGHAVVLGSTSTGQVAWRLPFQGPRPVRWPVPGCAWEPVLVWQESRSALEVASVVSGGISGRRSFPVGGPPLSISVGARAVWAAWIEPTGIEMLEIRQHDARNLRMPVEFPGDVDIGVNASGTCIVWTQAGAAFFARVGSNGLPAEPPVPLDLGHARGGRLALIPGPEPLVWAQRVGFIESEGQEWTSSLVLPGRASLTIDGLVYAVTWWGDRVAVVGPDEISFLNRSPW
jgi:hypothetical protein